MRQNSLKGFLKKSVCIGGAAAMIGASVVVAPANVQQAQAAPENVDAYVSCASYRAAEPTPEILGLDNVASNNAWSGTGDLKWSAPYYYLFGTSTYNSNPNPFMVNTISGEGQGMVTDQTRKGGPTASLEAYTTSKVVWDQLPDVILGNSSGYDYNSADFAQAAATANNKASYKTYGTNGGGEGVIYDSTNIYTMIDSMYDLSSAAKAAVAGTGKKLRYGDADSAKEITASFEEYVRGAQGYVLDRLAQDKKSKKKVALIYNYDKESNTYQVIPTGVAEGTATANRYLEAVQFVATNVADGKETTKVGSGRGVATVATASASEIADCDLVLVGSQAGSEQLSNTEDIVSSLPTAVQKKTYWVNSANGSAGSCYGVVMNSVENAQNIGRILPCLYPEYLDQSDMVAYYYQNFYHLNTGKLSEAIANAMDGVRNWNADGSNSTEAIAWSQSDVADYNAYNVENKLDTGMKYLRDNASALGANEAKFLAATDEYKTAKTAYTTLAAKPAAKAKSQSVSVKSKTLKIKAGKSAKIKASAKTSLSYAKRSGNSKISVSKAGRVSVKKSLKKGTYKVKVKISAKKTSAYRAASKTVTLKVKVTK